MIDGAAAAVHSNLTVSSIVLVSKDLPERKDVPYQNSITSNNLHLKVSKMHYSK